MTRHSLTTAVPTTLTLGNLVCGLAATAAAAAVETPYPQPATLAPWLILAAMALDGLDGLAARSLGGGSRFGVMLDCLADMVSFGVAPTAIIATASAGASYLSLLAAAGYACCAAVRLARYASEPPSPGFAGLPSPAAALTIVALSLTESTPAATLPLAAIIAGPLMISRIAYPHPIAGPSRSLGLMIAGVGAAVFAAAAWNRGLAAGSAWMLTAVAVAYATSPLWRKLWRR